MNNTFTISGKVSKFPGKGGWYYVSVPKKYTNYLREQRRAWGMYPITAHIGSTSWKTKLMMKKGGDFFVALNAAVRKEEGIIKGKSVKIRIKLIKKNLPPKRWAFQ